MKKRRPYNELNFICLTCDGVFSYTERVHNPIAEKIIKDKRDKRGCTKTPIMCKECFSKLT